MGFDEQLAELGPGKQLAALPIDKMIGMLGIGIAKAQQAMDENSINTAIKLGETVLNLPDPKDSDNMMSRSLLSLGFMPTILPIHRGDDGASGGDEVAGGGEHQPERER